FAISRWLKGDAEPRLPEFLTLIDAASLRLLDYVATFVDPAELPSVAAQWKSLESARRAAYEKPWSHVVLRALEMSSRPSAAQTPAWLARRFCLTNSAAQEAIELLAASGQIERRRGKWQVRDVQAVDTRSDRKRSQQLRAYWLRVAHARLEAGLEGVYGFNLMGVAERDVARLRELHATYYREMQGLVAASEPVERVLLFCTQLLELDVNADASQAAALWPSSE
ncbi:MAG TPA: DUF4423 domain-containing protein, partial [Polyangiaceae bacterium]|nr:DUF4423 domain-containing protein [Polyangiaceae bacterium]